MLTKSNVARSGRTTFVSWFGKLALLLVATLGLALLGPQQAHAAGNGVLTVDLVPVDSVTGAPISSIAFGEHGNKVAYRVQITCSVANCDATQLAFTPSQKDPMNLAAAAPRMAGSGTLLQFANWTPPTPGAAASGTDATGKAFSLGTLTAGTALTFRVEYEILNQVARTMAAANFYPDDFPIVMGATVSSVSAVADASSTASPVIWNSEVPTPTVAISASGSLLKYNQPYNLLVSMSDGSAVATGVRWGGASKYISAGSYEVVASIPEGAEINGPIPDGGVYDPATREITWSRGTSASPVASAAGGWGLPGLSGWYGDNPDKAPHSIPIIFPSDVCNLTETLDFAVRSTVDYLDDARSTKTASASSKWRIGCYDPAPGFDVQKRNGVPGSNYTHPTVQVPLAGNPPTAANWIASALNTGNVAALVTITDDGLDQPNMPVHRVTFNAPSKVDYILDDGTTGSVASATVVDAPAGRHFRSVTSTTISPIAPVRVDPSDPAGGASVYEARYSYTVAADAPWNVTRTNTMTSTMSWPSQSGTPGFEPQTKSSQYTVTLVGSKPKVQAVMGAGTVHGGGQLLPGSNVTFSLGGSITNLPSNHTFVPEYVFIAPPGWDISEDSVSFSGAVPAGQQVSYETRTVNGVEREVAVVTWPAGTSFSPLNPLPTMTIDAVPTNAVPAGSLSYSNGWIGDANRGWTNATADFVAAVQNTQNVDGSGDTGAWFSSASSNPGLQMGAVESLSVKKEICLPNTGQPDGCDWISSPGQSVPVTVGSTGIKYRITLQNTGNSQLQNVVAYDVLPWVGDTGLTPTTEGISRGSTFRETLESVSSVDTGLVLSYSPSTNPVRPEVSPNGNASDWGPGAVGSQSIRAAVTGSLPPLAEKSFVYTARVDPNADTDGLACNSVAISSRTTAAAEPLAVCAQLTTKPGLGLSKSADASQVSEKPKVGEVITYHFTMVNTGDVTLSNAVIVDALPELSSLSYSWPSAAGVLEPGASVTATATYALTQADIDAGTIANRATATSSSPGGGTVGSDEASVVTPLGQDPAISFVKTAGSASVSKAGDVITYTMTATNTGNTTLTGVSVHDPKPGVNVQTTTWPAVDGTLLPGQVVTQVATYTTTQNDIDSGMVDNTATAKGTAPDRSIVDESATATVTVSNEPKLSLVKSASPAGEADYVVGQVVSYTFVVTNEGNVTLSDLSLEETAFDGAGGSPAIDCASPVTSLAPGEQTTCTAGYTLTQDDIDRGSTTNTAIATALTPAGGTVTSAPSTVVLPGTSDPSMEFTKTATPVTVERAGDSVTYTFAATNTGNVTLTDVAVADPFPGLSVLTYDWPEGGVEGELAPGQKVTATATYSATQADIDSGSFTNTAILTATDPHDTGMTASASATVSAIQRGEIALVKSASAPTLVQAGGIVTYTFVMENTGTVTATNVTVDDPLPGLTPLVYDWPGADGVLAPGERATATGQYVLTQEDLDAGSLSNTATATGDVPSGDVVNSPPSSTSTDLPPTAELSLVKSASPSDEENYVVGQRITFTFTVTNGGNVTLNDPVVHEIAFDGEAPLDLSDCDTLPTALAPGEQAACTTSYTLTQNDIDRGSTTNTAVATAVTGRGSTVTSSESTVSLPGVPNPMIALTKSAEPASVSVAGELVTYTIRATNTGTMTLTDIVLTDSLPGLSELEYEWPGDPGRLAPGQVVTAVATYRATQEDLDAGSFANTASVEAVDPHGTAVYSSWTAVVTSEQSPKLVIVKTADGSGVSDPARPGQTVNYSFEVTNTGNVTELGVSVIDELPGLSDLVYEWPGVEGRLAPGEAVTATARYEITQSDIAAGSVSNTASAVGETVLGVTIESNRSTADLRLHNSESNLATTGASSSQAMLVGFALLLVGASIVLGVRGRRRRERT